MAVIGNRHASILYPVATERILGVPGDSVFSIDRDLMEEFERA